MCGILAELCFNGSLTPKQDFLWINELSKKRGPDHTGYISPDNLCQMAHNRLAILDISPLANQPFVSPSGRFVIVYNGEVYNHLDLRKKLPKDIHYKTHSDTETITVAIDAWGFKKTVEALDGMFALAAYDTVERKLLLARDFAGIKPLFYAHSTQRFVAASQYDQVVAFPEFRKNNINSSSLLLYLEQHFMPAPYGLVEQTGQLLPGEIMEVHCNGETRRYRYWELPKESNDNRYVCDESEAVSIIESHLEESVKSELQSDVPLGAFLSGGIDSPLVVYYAAKNVTHKLKAFSIGSDSPIHDESDDAVFYANAIGVNHHLEKMNSLQASQVSLEALASLHEPMADFSVIPTWLVSKLARREVTVALSGDGGDELFFGYERFWSIAKNIQFQFWPYWVKYVLYGADKVLFKNKHINSAVLSASQARAHRGLHSRISRLQIQQLFPDIDKQYNLANLDSFDYPSTSDELKLLQRMRYAEFYGMMQKTLRKVDLASMDNSLEVRVPFLKKDFIEKSLNISPYLSYGNGKKKEILKKLLQKKIPDSPVTTVKRGFSVPLGKWMREELKNTVAEILFDKGNLYRWGVDQKNLENFWKEHQSGKADYKWLLFTLLSLFKWDQHLRN